MLIMDLLRNHMLISVTLQKGKQMCTSKGKRRRGGGNFDKNEKVEPLLQLVLGEKRNIIRRSTVTLAGSHLGGISFVTL